MKGCPALFDIVICLCNKVSALIRKYKGGEGVSLPDCGNSEAVWIYPWWKYRLGE
jgi:hypothetical protein